MKKNIISVLVLSSLFVSTGCEKYLNREPKTAIPFSSLYDTYNSAEQAVNACYEPMGHEREYFNAIWAMGDAAAGDSEVGGDNSGTDQAPAQDIMLFKTQPSNTACGNFYRLSYLSIQRCNNLLAGTEDVSYNADRLRGEAYFLRALYHFNLYLVMGPVPIVTEPITGDAYTNPPSNRQDGDDAKGSKQMEKMFDQIIEDFEKAAGLLPSKYEADKGRATRGAANAYLAKVYAHKASLCETKQLFVSNDAKKFWTKVSEYASKVQAEGEYALVPDYHKLFTIEGENSYESIFEVQYIQGTDYGEKSEGSIMVIDFSPRGVEGLGEFGFGLNTPTLDLVSQYDIKKNDESIIHWDAKMTVITNDVAEMKSKAPKLLKDFKDYDPRLDMIIKPGDTINVGNKWLHIKNLICPKGFWTRKYMPNVGDSPNKFYGLNYCLYRYADLLLLKAEAEFALGNLSSALDLVNQVRKRARESRWVHGNGTGYMLGYKVEPGTTPADYTDISRELIRKERRLELAIEGQRFFDLVRWNEANDFCPNKEPEAKGRSLGYKKDQSVRLPIPATAVTEGKGNVTQNPGY